MLLVSQNSPFHPGLQPCLQTPSNLSQLSIQFGLHSVEQFLPYQPEGHAVKKKQKIKLIIFLLIIALPFFEHTCITFGSINSRVTPCLTNPRYVMTLFSVRAESTFFFTLQAIHISVTSC